MGNSSNITKVYLLFEKPEGYHHNVYRNVFESKVFAESFVNNKYDNVQYLSDMSTNKDAYYYAQTKKHKRKVLIYIKTENLIKGVISDEKPVL